MNATKVKTLNDLPKLPFELMLSHLSLEERLKLSAVSRSCHQKIHSIRLSSLCYSELPIGLIWATSRWVSGIFAENFIYSSRFERFFNPFNRSVFSELRHLRLCDLSLDLENPTAFTRIMNSFRHLEELDIVRAECVRERTFKLRLPMLRSIHLEHLRGIKKLTLDAPKLWKVRLMECSQLACFDLRVDLVHGESVERLLIGRWSQIAVLKLKNLKCLFIQEISRIDPTFLSSLEQLKEVHLDQHSATSVSQLFEQKQRYGRADLKIYHCGLLVNDPDDSAPLSDDLESEAFVRWVENPSRLATEIPFYSDLSYSTIELVAPGQEIGVLNRLTSLKGFICRPIQDIERFLGLLNHLKRIAALSFSGHQPQELFDRLPEHCDVQRLTINRKVRDVSFLLRLKHLNFVDVIPCQLDGELLQKAFENLRFISLFRFLYKDREVTVDIEPPKRFSVSLGKDNGIFSNPNAAIQFITRNRENEPKKRKAEQLE